VIDLGRVVLPDGEHYFGVAVGAGIDARVMGETAHADKRRWGIGAYMATTLRVLPDLKSTACVVTVDGQTLETHAALVLIMNCGEMIPPLVRVRPEINPEDGILDLVTVAADSPWQGLRGLFSGHPGWAPGEIRETPYIRYARGTRFNRHGRRGAAGAVRWGPGGGDSVHGRDRSGGAHRHGGGAVTARTGCIAPGPC
jgi:diacylglycerol kinase family enzyme